MSKAYLQFPGIVIVFRQLRYSPYDDEAFAKKQAGTSERNLHNLFEHVDNLTSTHGRF